MIFSQNYFSTSILQQKMLHLAHHFISNMLQAIILRISFFLKKIEVYKDQTKLYPITKSLIFWEYWTLNLYWDILFLEWHWPSNDLCYRLKRSSHQTRSVNTFNSVNSNKTNFRQKYFQLCKYFHLHSSLSPLILRKAYLLYNDYLVCRQFKKYIPCYVWVIAYKKKLTLGWKVIS